MTRSAIEYQQQAVMHRPSDPQQLRAEVLRLMGQGWTTRDVAVALRLHVPAVLNLLADQPDG
jgi:DNA-binding CsgD family transcriptional regulator